MYDYEYDEFYGWVGIVYDETFDKSYIVEYFDNEQDAEYWYCKKNDYSFR